MTRKDYQLIADCLNFQFNRSHANATALGSAIVEELCAMLAVENPRFDADRFKAACGAAVADREE
jgi:hypothetical protein